MMEFNRSLKHNGGEERFKKQKIYDALKNDYCKNHGIKLIRIPYTCFNKLDLGMLL